MSVREHFVGTILAKTFIHIRTNTSLKISRISAFFVVFFKHCICPYFIWKLFFCFSISYSWVFPYSPFVQVLFSCWFKKYMKEKIRLDLLSRLLCLCRLVSWFVTCKFTNVFLWAQFISVQNWLNISCLFYSSVRSWFSLLPKKVYSFSKAQWFFLVFLLPSKYHPLSFFLNTFVFFLFWIC